MLFELRRVESDQLPVLVVILDLPDSVRVAISSGNAVRLTDACSTWHYIVQIGVVLKIRQSNFHVADFASGQSINHSLIYERVLLQIKRKIFLPGIDFPDR